jgi:vacuolar-type H+-ATPase subunit I/STV1
MASTSVDNVVVENTVVVEKKTKKGKTPKVEVPVVEASTSKVVVSQEEQISNLVNQLSQLVKRVELLENEVTELKQQQSVGGSQTKQTVVKKEEKEKKTRAPTAYNLFMKEKMLELKDTHSSLSNIERMKMAAEAWSESKKS